MAQSPPANLLPPSVNKDEIIANLDLTVSEIELIVNALAQQPYISVARMIQKFQEIAADAMNNVVINNVVNEPNSVEK